MADSEGYPENRRLYGRRKGHKLRPARARLVDELLPKLAIARDRIEPGPLNLEDLFPSSPSALALEIGFGGGEHLAWQASNHRDTGFIGCEPFVNGIANLLVLIKRDGLDNIRIHDGDACDILDALPDRCLDQVFLLFPDPWPKTRHHKRRFVSVENLARLDRVTKKGAELHFASDDRGYIQWTLRHMHNDGRFFWLAEHPRDWRHKPGNRPSTRYETKALRQGREPIYLSFRHR
ncbi:MAG: tRNA (guanine(46)-N(7))-methyltransferase TrmB [Gammaproteobacteria bacterium]|nr:tRNA (guanine(46)-N(7))-methyltransferase TrmB [Gammaproteobacteria bacterium]